MCFAGENIEELFTRIAVVAFENVLMKEVEASSPKHSNGQLSNNSTLIRESIGGGLGGKQLCLGEA